MKDILRDVSTTFGRKDDGEWGFDESVMSVSNWNKRYMKKSHCFGILHSRKLDLEGENPKELSKWT